MRIEPIKKNRTSSFLISDQILALIQSGEIKPGDKLPSEQELCKMFGASRSTVREGICLLVATGHLETIHGKGTFVLKNEKQERAEINVKDFLETCSIHDLMEGRLMLEVQGVRFAANRAEKEDIDRLEQSLQRLVDCGDQIDVFFESDLDFHLAITEATGNRFVSLLTKVLLKELWLNSSKFKTIIPHSRSNTISCLQNILASIKAGDGDTAAHYMEMHLADIDHSFDTAKQTDHQKQK